MIPVSDIPYERPIGPTGETIERCLRKANMLDEVEGGGDRLVKWMERKTAYLWDSAGNGVVVSECWFRGGILLMMVCFPCFLLQQKCGSVL